MSDLIIGVLVELSILSFAVAVLYRLMAGKFLFPKRESVLPYQSGVIVKGDQVMRIVSPGPCWIRPRERLVLCDIRPRPLELSNFEVFTNDGAIIRLNLSAEYKVSNPATFMVASTHAADALVSQMRRAIVSSARAIDSATLISAPDVLASRIANAMLEPATKFGFTVSSVQVWDAYIARGASGTTAESVDTVIH
jgi:regulator of protease activity HflC (stomatin/prohibitin superfamily)